MIGPRSFLSAIAGGIARPEAVAVQAAAAARIGVAFVAGSDPGMNRVRARSR